MNEKILEVTKKIVDRSAKYREIYLQRIEENKKNSVFRKRLSCSNLAHAIAPLSKEEKISMVDTNNPNMAIVTAYNDMLSAHEPYKNYPDILKSELLKSGSTAQVAGGVAAMCDGITQGKDGMQLSLFSRDNIAMSSAIALSHDVYDGAFYLGVCDKIVPGLLMAALKFGHLPSIFVPSGPMPSGISNSQKAKIREEFASGKIDEKELFKAEASSYHSCGTCTFFGTANSNQMLLEMMGLQLPNSSFVNTNTKLREELTKKAALTLKTMVEHNITISDIVTEKSFVNAIVGLMATGGSTNHTIHLIAMAKSAGIILTWEDFDEISKVTPLLCKMYPNGSADVNAFHESGGMAVVIDMLLKLDLVHKDVQTVVGFGLENYVVNPKLKNNRLIFEELENPISKNIDVISTIEKPFSKEGGVKLLKGNLGESIIKTSALKKEQYFIEAPAIVFETEEELKEAFLSGKLEKDFIAVVRNQGPKANGMPELHSLMPLLGSLQSRGFKVAIVTDGRMSGASGKVPSAIHLTPESKDNGNISKIIDGDIIRLDVNLGELNLLLNEKELALRKIQNYDNSEVKYGLGRELFSLVRANVSSANSGATIFALPGEEKL